MQLTFLDKLDHPDEPPSTKAAGLDRACPQPGTEPNETLAPKNLGEALAAFSAAACDHPHRIQICTSIRMVGRAIGMPLEQIPTDPSRLRPLLETACVARAKVKPRSWSTAKSKVLCALRDLEVDIVASRDLTPISSAWAGLVKGLEDRGAQIALSRIMRHFTRTGVEPHSVSPAAFEAFRRELLDKSAKARPETIYRQVVRKWNLAVGSCPAWPQVPIEAPKNPRHYSLPWNDFPPEFLKDVEAFLLQVPTDNIFSKNYRRPVRDSTTETRRKTIRNLASALVLSGQVGVNEVVSLEVLTRPTNVEAGFRHLWNTRSDEVTARHVQQVALLKIIASNWLKDEARAKILGAYVANFSEDARDKLQPRMTEKNKDRLRQFDDPANVDTLLALPFRILRTVEAKPNANHRDSVRVMYALITAILCFVPIRLKNFTRLRIGANVFDSGRGSKRCVRIYLSSEETKNSQPYEAPLPQHLFPLLDAWMTKYRERACNAASPYVFPNPAGEMRVQEALSGDLVRFWERETGLHLNPHLFRHICAKLYLDRDPLGVEVVRQLLGHSSIQVTQAFYAELQTKTAFRSYEEAVLLSGKEAPAGGSKPQVLPRSRAAKRQGHTGRRCDEK